MTPGYEPPALLDELRDTVGELDHQPTPGVDQRVDGSMVHWLATSDGQALSHQQKQALAEELLGLQNRLDTLPVIEQAKGILMGFFGIDDQAAFAVLRRWSSHRNVKLRTIALQLTSAASYRHPSGAVVDDQHPTTLHRVIAIFQQAPGDAAPSEK